MNSPHGLRTKWSDRINCGCKINLRLKVTSRRVDGLHDLSSCFLFLEHPGDVLSIEDSDPGIVLECPGCEGFAGTKNIVWRAAELYAEKCSLVPQWRISLEKKVPVAAGLGGGSADAAAVLLLLNRRYCGLSEQELTELAFSLGADVPFFLHRKAAWVSGAGEVIEVLENMPPIPQIMIVNPGFPVSAKWAYANMDKGLVFEDDPALRAAFAAGYEPDWQGFCRNDLAPALMKKFPVLEILREKLFALGALAAQVSGSGSSLFALFDADVGTKAQKLRADFPEMKAMRIFAAGNEY